MAACLPRLWQLRGQTQRDDGLSSLDATVLQVLLADTLDSSMEDFSCRSSTDRHCRTRLIILSGCRDYGCPCPDCHVHQELHWRRAAVRLELALLKRGWGCK